MRFSHVVGRALGVPVDLRVPSVYLHPEAVGEYRNIVQEFGPESAQVTTLLAHLRDVSQLVATAEAPSSLEVATVEVNGRTLGFYCHSTKMGLVIDAIFMDDTRSPGPEHASPQWWKNLDVDHVIEPTLDVATRRRQGHHSDIVPSAVPLVIYEQPITGKLVAKPLPIAPGARTQQRKGESPRFPNLARDLRNAIPKESTLTVLDNLVKRAETQHELTTTKLELSRIADRHGQTVAAIAEPTVVTARSARRNQLATVVASTTGILASAVLGALAGQLTGNLTNGMAASSDAMQLIAAATTATLGIRGTGHAVTPLAARMLFRSNRLQRLRRMIPTADDLTAETQQLEHRQAALVLEIGNLEAAIYSGGRSHFRRIDELLTRSGPGEEPTIPNPRVAVAFADAATAWMLQGNWDNPGAGTSLQQIFGADRVPSEYRGMVAVNRTHANSVMQRSPGGKQADGKQADGTNLA